MSIDGRFEWRRAGVMRHDLIDHVKKHRVAAVLGGFLGYSVHTLKRHEWNRHEWNRHEGTYELIEAKALAETIARLEDG